jgi:tyrosyl-DNA phosphodiesterase 2
MAPKQKDQPVPAHSWNGSAWTAQDVYAPTSQSEQAFSELKLVQYNVWFEGHRWQERCHALLELLQAHQPDAVCFQEVTDKFVTEIASNAWIRERYVLSDVSGTTYGTYGTTMLVHRSFGVQFIIQDFHSGQGRSLVRAILRVPGFPHPICLATSHFESLRPERPSRKKQFNITFAEVLAPMEHSIVTGDFNMDPSWAVEQVLLPPAYVDAWTADQSHEGDMGATMPGTEQFPPWRPDRVLVRSPDWAIRSCSVIGTQPLPGRDEACSIPPSSEFFLIIVLHAGVPAVAP